MKRLLPWRIETLEERALSRPTYLGLGGTCFCTSDNCLFVPVLQRKESDVQKHVPPNITRG